ncbi:MAG TPA: hypothetical protein DD611_01295 [Alphaproteobacteria bacterium]|nr:hypothetical protein [Alphaproteobacteria bacterium]
MKHKYDLIFSIGQACACSSNLRKNDLQFASYPMDWLFGNDLAGRVQILVSRFDRFIDVSDLEYTYSERSISCDAYHNKYNDLTFNHDFAAATPLTETYLGVRQKYERRIGRLLNGIENSERVLAVYMETPDSGKSKYNESDIVKIHDKLQRAFAPTQIDLLYISPDTKLPHGARRVVLDNSGVRWIVSEYQTKDKSKPSYTPDAHVLAKIFRDYSLNATFGFKLRRAILKIVANLILCRKHRRAFRKKYHLK